MQVIKIEVGKTIPVDGILIQGKDVTCDESAMTGESYELKKETLRACEDKKQELIANEELKSEMDLPSLPSPILLSGTKITQGEGFFLVIVVGEKSAVGKIMGKILQKSEASPLQKKLEVIAQDVGKLGFFTAIITILVMLLRFIIVRIRDGGWADDDVSTCFTYVLLGLTIIVVAIPEGLPLAVTIALAYSVGRMYQEKNFVKTLMSCETMGGANTICSDKTGTLTENIMRVMRIYLNDATHTINDKLLAYEFSSDISNELKQIFLEGLCCNSTATDKYGNPTEKALMEMIKKYGVEIEAKRGELLCDGDYIRFPFNSSRKKMSTIIKKFYQSDTETGKKSEYTKRLYIKGASEIVVNACSKIHLSQGVIEMTGEYKEKIDHLMKEFNKNALRTLGVAYRNLKTNEYGAKHDEKTGTGKHLAEESDLTLIAVIGIRDSIRPKVSEAVDKCKQAGIKVRMVTGDNPVTAAAIAKECHILPESFDCGKTGLDLEDDKVSDIVLEGPKFEEMVGGLKKVCDKCDTEECKCSNPTIIEKVRNPEVFAKIMPKLAVMARSRPEDKYLLVTALKEKNSIVAVTGDGTNDAPALKKANVGFAMGIQGTDIARDAASIVILDDNFASIITAVKWGRNIYDSIRKFLQFQLSVNLVALALSFASSVIISESPLSPIQMLWVNLIMDSLASLALATESPSEELLTKPPYRKDAYIISKKMMKHIVGQALYQIVVLFIFLFAGEYIIPEDDTDIKGIQLDINGKVRTGRRFDYDGSEDNEDLYTSSVANYIGGSRHYTFIFTLFVFLQLFNEINARRIDDQLNVFEGITKHPLFVVIWVATATLQVIITEFGGRVFRVCALGLTWYQWFIAITLASGGLLVRLAIRLIPDRACPQVREAWIAFDLKVDGFERIRS